MREVLIEAARTADTPVKQRRLAHAAAVIARAAHDACDVTDPVLTGLVDLTERWGLGDDVFGEIVARRDESIGLPDNDCAVCAAFFADAEACVGEDAVANMEDLLEYANELAVERGVAFTLPSQEIRSALAGPS